jgi:uncharacterized protein YdeI (YjbR/CyaY-like superfamily)
MGAGVIELPELLVPDAAGWRKWLRKNHESSDGVMLVLTKKGGDVTTLTYDDALDEALCAGWIDGQVRRRDEATVCQRFSPRGPKSMWSARNVGYIAQLESEGRMTRRGRSEVERAKADGRWDVAYAGPATIEVPADFAAAIAARPRAQAMFDVLTSQNRFALLHRLGQLKTAAARDRRIAQYVDMLARGETVYPQKRTHPDD